MDVTIACPCPPKRDGTARHESDTVTLREKLDFRSATAIRNGIRLLRDEDANPSAAEILAVLTEGYILFGIESWSLVDEKAQPLPVSRAAIRERLLADGLVAEPIGDAADELYSATVLLPLLARASTSSPATPTPSPASGASTSATQTPPSPRKPSRRSSTTTSPTDGIATITPLRGGDSSSSLSSRSAS